MIWFVAYLVVGITAATVWALSRRNAPPALPGDVSDADECLSIAVAWPLYALAKLPDLFFRAVTFLGRKVLR